MIVLRVEHPKDKLGPYYDSDDRNPGLYNRAPHSGWTGRPMPSHDWPSHHLRFGFVSWKQLRGWFHWSELQTLVRNGFRFVRYEVPDSAVYADRYQCAFDYSQAREVTR